MYSWNWIDADSNKNQAKHSQSYKIYASGI